MPTNDKTKPTIKVVGSILVGIMTVGSFLGALSDSFAFLSSRTSLILTLICFLLYLSLEVYQAKFGALDIFKEGEKFSWKSFRLVFAGVIIILFLPFFSTLVEGKKEQGLPRFSKSNKALLKIAIIPFSNLSTHNYYFSKSSEQIIDRLENLKDSHNLSIDLVHLDTSQLPSFLTFDAMSELANQVNADLIIGGRRQNDLKTPGKIRVKYILNNKFNVDPVVRQYNSGIRELETHGALYNGYLQENIDYIIQWVEGMYYHKIGNHKKSILCFEEIWEQNLTDTFNYETYFRLGAAYIDANENTKAIMLNKKSLEIIDTTLKEFKSHYVTINQNLALAYTNDEVFTSADSIYRHLLRSQDLFPDTLVENYAKNYARLGSIYQQVGQYEKALKFHFHALDLFKRIKKINFLEVGYTYHNIGTIYQENGQKQYDQAEYFLSMALKIYKKHLAPNHAMFAKTYIALGNVFFSRGKYTTALIFFHKGFALQRQMLPDLSLNLTISLQNISNTYTETRLLDSAIFYANWADSVYIYNHDTSHTRYGLLLINKSHLYHEIGDYKSAIQYGKRADAFFPDNTSNNNCLYNGVAFLNLGEAYFDFGEVEESQFCYYKAEDFFNKGSLSKGLYIGYAKKGIAKIEKLFNCHESALAMANSAKDEFLFSLGQNHEDVQKINELIEEFKSE